jgi:predicted  nucleic acid-binding Zn-ribbon protein
VHLTNANVLNLTNEGDYARESPILNDIIRSTSLEVAKFQQQRLIREAEQSRLIAEANQDRLSKFTRFVRLPVGRSIVATGRRIQGCPAASRPDGANPGPALKLAR